MSAENNGVIRIGRKGIKKFAFGDDGEPFDVDVVVTFQSWIEIDGEFRERTEDRSILTQDMSSYHRAAVEFVTNLATGPLSCRSALRDEDAVPPSITTAEALDFLARLREQYDELTDFFQPRSRVRPESRATSEVELQFSEEVS